MGYFPVTLDENPSVENQRVKILIGRSAAKPIHFSKFWRMFPD
jgi:hypothetical protein